jgi:hypothetical protein
MGWNGCLQSHPCVIRFKAAIQGTPTAPHPRDHQPQWPACPNRAENHRLSCQLWGQIEKNDAWGRCIEGSDSPMAAVQKAFHRNRCSRLEKWGKTNMLFVRKSQAAGSQAGQASQRSPTFTKINIISSLVHRMFICSSKQHVLQSMQRCVARDFCEAVSLRPNRAGAGFFGSLLTSIEVFSPLTTTTVTGEGAAWIAERVKPSLSAGHLQSKQRRDLKL